MVKANKQNKVFKRSLLTQSILYSLAIIPLSTFAEEAVSESEARKIEVIEVTSQKRVENSQARQCGS